MWYWTVNQHKISRSSLTAKTNSVSTWHVEVVVRWFTPCLRIWQPTSLTDSKKQRVCFCPVRLLFVQIAVSAPAAAGGMLLADRCSGSSRRQAWSWFVSAIRGQFIIQTPPLQPTPTLPHNPLQIIYRFHYKHPPGEALQPEQLTFMKCSKRLQYTHHLQNNDTSHQVFSTSFKLTRKLDWCTGSSHQNNMKSKHLEQDDSSNTPPQLNVFSTKYKELIKPLCCSRNEII